MENQHHFTPDKNTLKYTQLIAKLRAIKPDKNKWFKAKQGYPDWTFKQLVEYVGFDEAVKMARSYRNMEKYRNCRLAASSRSILDALQ